MTVVAEERQDTLNPNGVLAVARLYDQYARMET
jgi:hypothetical protein